MIKYEAIYNNFYISGNDYTITKIDIGTPTSKINRHELARADGQIVTNKNYGERAITVTGKINATSLTDMHTKLDTLKANLNGYEQNLIINLDDIARKYTATVSNFTYKTTGYYCEFNIGFTANSFGRSVTNTSLTFGTYTSSNTAYVNTIIGSYKAEPIIDCTINFVEPFWDSKYIRFYNAVTNQLLQITRTWALYERFIVNAQTKTVTVYPTTVTLIDACNATTGWTTTTHTLSLETANMKQGTGALKVVMGSATATMDWIRLNATSTDLSSTVGKVVIPIFIPTPTSGTVASVDFYTGSDATLASNYCYWRVTTQWNGSALASNAWNYVIVDLSASPTSTTGSPTRTAIKSIKVVLNATTTMQLNGALLDYVTIQKAGVTAEVCDYEGSFIDLNLGSSTITVSDELTSRNITITGEYSQRYL